MVTNWQKVSYRFVLALMFVLGVVVGAVVW